MSGKKVKHQAQKNGTTRVHPVAQGTSLSRRCWTGVFMGLFLILATLAIFWPVKNFKFINMDDTEYVTENPQVLNGLNLEGAAWAFTSKDASNWHPLTWLSHMLDIRLYGLNPGGHHLTNLLFHFANTLLLFFLLKQMTGSSWRSGFVAALFALHPLHVESVAWVAERKDVLSTFFGMLTMMAYVHYVRQTGLNRYLWVFLSFALGLMSKPMLVTLPFLLLLLDYWPLGRLRLGLGEQRSRGESSERPGAFRLVWEKAPLFILVIVSCLLTVWAQRGAIASLEALPLGTRMANALVSYVSYIGKMIWPARLAIQYPYLERLPLWQILGAGLLLLGISVLVIREARRRPYLVVGWLWYLGTLVPVIGLVQVGSQAMADRYTYVPLIGLFVMMIWGIPDLLSEWRYRRIVLPVSAALVMTFLMILTRIQLQYWHDSLRLFKHSLDVTTDNYLAHGGYGVALTEQGREEEAIIHYTKALKIRSYSWIVHHNLGNALVRRGRYQEAIDHFEAALRIKPDFEKTYNSLGVALARQGKYQEAVVQYHQALKIRKDYAEAHNNLGVALSQLGKTQEAMAHYQDALRIMHSYADAHYNIGNLLALQRKYEEAIAQFNEVLKYKPDDAEIHYNIGVALAEQGKLKEAIDHYSHALRINPRFDQARFALALAYVVIGDRDSALRQYEVLKAGNPDLADRLLQQREFKLTPF